MADGGARIQHRGRAGRCPGAAGRRCSGPGIRSRWRADAARRGSGQVEELAAQSADEAFAIAYCASLDGGARGCHLALADIDDDGLQRTAAEIIAAGVRISRHHLDVSDAGAVAAFPPRVTAEHPCVDILVNNAGVALGGTFEQVRRPISNGCSRSISGAWYG